MRKFTNAEHVTRTSPRSSAVIFSPSIPTYSFPSAMTSHTWYSHVTTILPQKQPQCNALILNFIGVFSAIKRSRGHVLRFLFLAYEDTDPAPPVREGARLVSGSRLVAPALMPGPGSSFGSSWLECRDGAGCCVSNRDGRDPLADSCSLKADR